MRIAVICPSCKKTGTLPEAMRAARQVCRLSSTVRGERTETRSEIPPGLLAAMLEDDGGAAVVRPLPLASTRRSAQPEPSSSAPTAVYAAIGISGVCALLLAVVATLMMNQSSEKPNRIAQERGHRSAPRSARREAACARAKAF